MSEIIHDLVIEQIEVGKYCIVGFGDDPIPAIIRQEWCSGIPTLIQGYSVCIIDQDEAICGPNSEFPDEFVVVISSPNGTPVPDEWECTYSLGENFVVIDFMWTTQELDAPGPVV